MVSNVDDIELTGKSKDLISENISYLQKIFPEVFTEEKIDFEKLKILLGENIDDSNEKYSFTWSGKAQAIKISQKQSAGTLRPCRQESKNWDTTQNLYIEGDNLEVLKLLQKGYCNRIKVIYIDPPFNTGKDFIYPDNQENYFRISSQLNKSEGEKNIAGVKPITNPKNSGRFHSNWLNMMYPRLKLAKNLLTADGLIFISINDNEYANLKKICDEIFGEENFIENYIWEHTFRPYASSKINRKNSEYVLCYAKSKKNIKKLIGEKFVSEGLFSLTDNSVKKNSLCFSSNVVKTFLDDGIYQKGDKGICYLEDNIEVKDNTVINEFSLSGSFIWNQNYLDEQIKNNTEIIIPNESFVPYTTSQTVSQSPKKIIPRDKVGDIFKANAEIEALFGSKVFDYPKPSSLIKYLISYLDDKNFIVLDFFSGSATVADAVFKLNFEDNGERNFILVQIPEQTNEDSNAFKLGYENICEIGKERIYRAGNKIVEESGNKDLDIGFKVFKLDSSNLKKWDSDYDWSCESLTTDILKEDRSDEDLIYEIMLKYGVDLTFPVEKRGNVYSVGSGALVMCLEKNVTKEITDEILKFTKNHSSSRVVFRDDGFNGDNDKTHIKEILKRNNISCFITI